MLRNQTPGLFAESALHFRRALALQPTHRVAAAGARAAECASAPHRCPALTVAPFAGCPVGHPFPRGRIPRVFHQTWRTAALPARFRQYRRQLRALHPSFVHLLWTDAHIFSFVRDEFPRFFRRWELLPVPIMRVDAFRYMLLLRFGGVYAGAFSLAQATPLLLSTGHTPSTHFRHTPPVTPVRTTHPRRPGLRVSAPSGRLAVRLRAAAAQRGGGPE